MGEGSVMEKGPQQLEHQRLAEGVGGVCAQEAGEEVEEPEGEADENGKDRESGIEGFERVVGKERSD